MPFVKQTHPFATANSFDTAQCVLEAPDSSVGPAAI